MGRYYSGDISGKFWFAVQSSDTADRFGKTGYAPSHLEYYYEIEDLPIVKEEIASIEAKLGDKKERLYAFFNQEGKYIYQDEELREIDISEEDLREYADLLLGYQIAEALEENGSCQFTAEL
jgi:hypothetical protein